MMRAADSRLQATSKLAPLDCRPEVAEGSLTLDGLTMEM